MTSAASAGNLAEPKVWLITGASRGLGHAIARAALDAGHCVVATSRDGVVPDLGEHYARRLLTLPLDVTSDARVTSVVREATDRFDRLDVLVNNAGYGELTIFEEASEDRIQAIFDTNLFGTMRVTKAVLPTMRAQRSGHIFNMSSAAGYNGLGPILYHTSKFAVTGFSQALAFEVNGFGISVTNVAPGMFRTDFLDRSSMQNVPARKIDDYDSARQRLENFTHGMNHEQRGDPALLGRLLVDVADSEAPPIHLLVGVDAFASVQGALECIAADMKRWRAASEQTSLPPQSVEVDPGSFWR